MGKGPNKSNVCTIAMFGQYVNYGSHSSLAKKNLLKVKTNTEVKKCRQYCISFLLPPLFLQNKHKHSFLNSWTFYVNQFQQRITNVVSSEQQIANTINSVTDP